METIDNKKLLAKYKRNESLNNHNVNGKMLADIFGTDDEKQTMNAICERSKKLGHTLHEDIRVRYLISEKYYPLLAK